MCSHLVFHHATASGIRVSEPLLCLCVPLFGREAVPLRRHLVVLRDSLPPVLIRASHVPLSIREPVLSALHVVVNVAIELVERHATKFTVYRNRVTRWGVLYGLSARVEGN